MLFIAFKDKTMFLIIISSIVFIFLLWTLLGLYISGKVLYPRKYTLKDVLENPELREQWELGRENHPGDMGLPYENVSFKSYRRKNPLLQGWFIPGKGKKCIILIHGRWSNRLKTLKYLEFLKNLESPCLLFDLATSGESEGKQSTMGYQETSDVLAAVDFLRNKKGMEEFIFYAFSMGCASAVLAAMEEKSVKKIILDSPFASVRRIIREKGKEQNYPDFIVKLGFKWFEWRGNLNLDRLEIQNQISGLAGIPVFILHSKEDEFIHYSHSLELFERAQEPKYLKIFDSGEHVRLYKTHPEEYSRMVLDFLKN
jgi:alpha-beta hydrolase superfamily lysophospholipase